MSLDILAWAWIIAAIGGVIWYLIPEGLKRNGR